MVIQTNIEVDRENNTGVHTIECHFESERYPGYGVNWNAKVMLFRPARHYRLGAANVLVRHLKLDRLPKDLQRRIWRSLDNAIEDRQAARCED